MNQVVNEVTVNDLVRMFPVFKSNDVIADFIAAKQDHEELSGVFHFPCRFNAFLIVICQEGEVTVHLNLRTFVLGRNMVFFCEPGNIIQLKPAEGARFYMAAITENMALEMAPNALQYYKTSVSARVNPCLTMGDRDFETLICFEDLLIRVMETRIDEKKELILSYLNALMYFLRTFWRARQTSLLSEYEAHSPRTRGMVDEFIRLVTEHHMSEHYLAFYAKKLDITPKYLSKLVREVTGRSAPEWIDAFLVLEAKNMLKYSTMAIKEIVYEMHFPDQSSFYKFFKLHTGMIPSEYRKS